MGTELQHRPHPHRASVKNVNVLGLQEILVVSGGVDGL